MSWKNACGVITLIVRASPFHMSMSKRKAGSLMMLLTTHPQLSNDEERMLAERIQAGDEAAKRRMIEANLRLLGYVARRYSTDEAVIQESIQNGYFGLVQAANSFDPSRLVPFASYAVLCIRQAILADLHNQSRLTCLPVHVQAQLRAMDRATDSWFCTHGEEPTVEQLASTLGLSVARVCCMQSLRLHTLSLDALVADTEDITLLDQISDESAQIPFEEIEEGDRIRQEVRHALRVLTERERQAVSLCFGLDQQQTHTYAEIGHHIGVSRTWAHQLVVRALRKLRQERGLQALYGEQP